MDGYIDVALTFRRERNDVYRTTQDGVRMGEQLHAEDVPVSVRQSEQLHLLHCLLPGEVSAMNVIRGQEVANACGKPISRALVLQIHWPPRCIPATHQQVETGGGALTYSSSRLPIIQL